jgi:hypothetical protein
MAAQPQPAAGPARDLFAEAGMNAPAAGMTTCPACQAPLHQQAVLCVKCGFDKRLGKKVKGVETAAPAHGGHGDGAAVLLARAAKAIDDDKAEEAKTRAQGLPAWAYAGLLVGLFIVTANMLVNGLIHSMFVVGAFTVGMSNLCQAIFGLQFIIRAFKVDPLITLACLGGSILISIGIYSLGVVLILYVIPPEAVFLSLLLLLYRHPISSLSALIYIPVTLRNWEYLNQPYYRYYFGVVGLTIGLTIYLFAYLLLAAFPPNSEATSQILTELPILF